MGQLLSETKNACPECSDCGTTVNITYDNYGNILTKGNHTYGYDNVLWKDRLTSFDRQSITYDAQGNPTNYLGHNLTWEKGRQLKSFDNNTYTYNASGIRTSKTVDGIRHDYVVDGGRILKETWNDNVLIPIYNNEQEVVGIYYNCEPYYFYKNLQGDVIGISDNDGRAVVTYSYDAWGVCTVLKDISGVGLANINPYRYRSYYYDVEIGMYYLQSRYYDPVVGRFINADVPEVVKIERSILVKNLYCYCLNDPVNITDSSGAVAVRLITAIINGIVAVLTYILFESFFYALFHNLSLEGYSFPSFKRLLWEFAWGAISGLFVPTCLSRKSMAIISALLSSLRTIIEDCYRYKKFNFKNFFISFMVGLVTGYISGPGLKQSLPGFRKSTGTYANFIKRDGMIYFNNKIPLNKETFITYAKGLWLYIGGLVSSMIVSKIS